MSVSSMAVAFMFGRAVVPVIAGVVTRCRVDPIPGTSYRAKANVAAAVVIVGSRGVSHW
jgi:hypothetical protein